MSKSSPARIRRLLVRRGVDEELKRRGIDPKNPDLREMVEKRIREKEAEEKGLVHVYE